MIGVFLEGKIGKEGIVRMEVEIAFLDTKKLLTPPFTPLHLSYPWLYLRQQRTSNPQKPNFTPPLELFLQVFFLSYKSVVLYCSIFTL